MRGTEEGDGPLTQRSVRIGNAWRIVESVRGAGPVARTLDRKSTRLNSSH